MKNVRILLLLLCCWVAHSTVYAQDLQELVNRLNQLETKQKEYEATQQNYKVMTDKFQQRQKADSLRINFLMDSLNRSASRMNSLYEEVETYKTTLNKQAAIVKDVSRRVELSDEARYKVIYNNLIVSAELFELLNDELNTLYAISQVESYRSLLSNLNNPADESMGFSYNQKVMELLNQKINVKKDKGQILQLASVFLQKPLIQSFTSTVPILNVGTSLVSYIAAIAADRKEVTPNDIIGFKNELDKYTNYYVKMHNLNADFMVNLRSYQVQNNSMHSKLSDFVVKNINSGGFKIETKDQMKVDSDGEYLSKVFRTYNREAVQKWLKDMEAKHTKNGKIDYAKLLESNPNLYEINKRIPEVAYFCKQFDYLYGQYISIIEENNKGLLEVFKEAEAQKLSNDNSKIQNQITILNDKKTEAIRGIRTAVNITKIRDLLDKLDEYTETI